MMDGTISRISRIRSNANKLIVKELELRGHYGLAPSHGNILSILIFEGEMTKTFLSDKINKDRSTVTVLLRKLQQLGYIDTKINTEDSRSHVVYLTQKGSDMKKDFIEISQLLYQRQYEGMTNDEIESFKRCLMQLDHNFKTSV